MKKAKIAMITPAEIEDSADRIGTKDLVDEFGATALSSAIQCIPSKAQNKEGIETNLQMVIDNAKELMRRREDEALTRLDVLKDQTDSLGRCVFIASQIYENSPIPDHAYQLSALSSAFNASLGQVDKMQDPVGLMNQINALLESMFRDVLRNMSVGIDRMRQDLITKHPEMVSQINSNFERMLKEISPETEERYERMQSELRKILGIRQRKKSGDENKGGG